MIIKLEDKCKSWVGGFGSGRDRSGLTVANHRAGAAATKRKRIRGGGGA
jgi:hypothetical protein